MEALVAIAVLAVSLAAAAVLLRRALSVKPQEIEAMPTLEDVYQLTAYTNTRIDAMEKKLDSLHDEVKEAMVSIMEAVSPRVDA